LVKSSSSHFQLPGVWALGELATGSALELLMPLAWSSHQDVQHAALQCLVQIENKRKVPASVSAQFAQLLAELRSKTDWIL
jgi:hypothetical protein